MSVGLIVAGVIGGVAALGVAGSYGVANILFKKVIPRQDGVKVDLNEMGDGGKWQEYMKVIQPNKEYLLSLPCEHLKIKSKDGLTLCGDYYKAENSSDKLVICFHGYTSGRMSSCSFAAFMLKEGYDCLLVDNRAHGDSEGEYIGFGILDRFDCMSWINYVNEKYDKKEILLYGVSMGGTTVIMASADKNLPDNVKAVIADCAFTSPFDVFSHVLKKDYKMPAFPTMEINNKICKKKAGYGFKDYSTLDAVKETKCPILFIHGEEDNFVPVWMSDRNYEECLTKKALVKIKGAGHGAIYYENGEEYRKAVKDFLDNL
ncbi:MAG: alpha/beta hydrolase [Ruminiclostridium sp.]|nr:alpha/beta hydrolase [Ruminiclostridium sp.]